MLSHKCTSKCFVQWEKIKKYVPTKQICATAPTSCTCVYTHMCVFFRHWIINFSEHCAGFYISTTSLGSSQTTLHTCCSVMWNRLSLSLVGKMTFSCHLNKSKHKSSSHKNKMNHATSPVSAAWMQCLSNAGISREYNLNFKGCLSLTCAGITGIKHVLIIAWAQQFLSSNVNVRTENGVMTVSQVRTHFFLYIYI